MKNRRIEGFSELGMVKKKTEEVLNLVEDIVMREFGKDIWNWIKENAESVFEIPESDAIMEIAAKHGLARQVEYDPEIHGDADVDLGDKIWWYGDAI